MHAAVLERDYLGRALQGTLAASCASALNLLCDSVANHFKPSQQVNRLSISPDKRFLAAAGNGTVKLYDIAATAAGSGGANVGPVRAQDHPDALNIG